VIKAEVIDYQKHDPDVAAPGIYTALSHKHASNETLETNNTIIDAIIISYSSYFVLWVSVMILPRDVPTDITKGKSKCVIS
jgi:hypothetical protein